MTIVPFSSPSSVFLSPSKRNSPWRRTASGTYSKQNKHEMADDDRKCFEANSFTRSTPFSTLSSASSSRLSSLPSTSSVTDIDGTSTTSHTSYTYDECNMNNPPQPAKTLFVLCREKSWHKAMRHCKQRPFDAHFQCYQSRESCLAAACRHKPPVKLIKLLIEANPHANEYSLSDTFAYESNILPLHIACRSNASIFVIQEILSFYTGSSLLLQSHLACAVPALWQSRDTTDAVENYQSAFWQKMHIVLKALAKARQGGHSDHKLFVLHAAIVSILSTPVPQDCLHKVLEFALDQYPEQVSQRDPTGQFPLHVALVTATPLTYDDLLNISCKQPAAVAQQQQRRFALERLIKLFPTAAQLDDWTQPQSCLPLHTCLAGGGFVWQSGVKELVVAAPATVLALDPVQKLYPFQLAAAAFATNSNNDNTPTQLVDTIYRLLRSEPSVLKKHCSRSKSLFTNTSTKRHGPVVDTTLLGHNAHASTISSTSEARADTLLAVDNCFYSPIHKTSCDKIEQTLESTDVTLDSYEDFIDIADTSFIISEANFNNNESNGDFVSSHDSVYYDCSSTCFKTRGRRRKDWSLLNTSFDSTQSELTYLSCSSSPKADAMDVKCSFVASAISSLLFRFKHSALRT